MRGSILLPALVAALFVSAVPLGAAEPNPGNGGSRVAAIDGAATRLGRQTTLPAILSEADIEAYSAAVAAQNQARWGVADRALARVRDPILVGNLLARRYLTEGYRVDAGELRSWLSRYGDQPDAVDIYELAKKSLGGNISPPLAVTATRTNPSRGHDEDATWEDFSVEANRNLPEADRRKAGALKDRFRETVRRGDFETAKVALDGAEMHRVFDPVDYDELKTVLAAGLFAAGRDDEARTWAEQAADRSGDVLPEAHWVAGLATWRLGRHGQAAYHFESVANAADGSPWLISAGAYWAARANLAGGHPELVNHWLHLAAANPRAFYGLLARRALGQDIFYSWEARPFTDLDAEKLLRLPAARRALALLQLHDPLRAEEELNGLALRASPAVAQSLLALAHAANLPGLAVRMGESAEGRDGRLHDSAAYPLPDWRPTNGWSVDRALVLAIARQESQFNPHARSAAGAVGLMQLMPRTARSLGKHTSLTDPSVNLELGQRLVKTLLEDDAIRGNLLFMAVSYNSGQGTLARWLQSIHHGGDALLFMESIPSRETRAFVERVMTNYWAYSNRLGLSSSSLDSIAAGDWPMYDTAQSNAMAVKYAKNR